MAALLDVSTLIALVDSDHVGHGAIQKWFMQHRRSGWATCPLTENGMVRVLSQAAYRNSNRTPAEIVKILNAIKTVFKFFHQFWPDPTTTTDSSSFDSEFIAGPKQVTNI